MATSKLLSWALCLALFGAAFSSRILSIAASSLTATGIASGTRSLSSWVAVALMVGMIVGPLLVWLLSRFVGRKPVVLCAIVSGILAAILTTSASLMQQLFVGAGFTGLSLGMVVTTASLWLVETAETPDRCKKIVLLNIAAAAGSAVATWIEFIFTMTATNGQVFRACMALQLVFQVPAFFLVFRSPESFRWLLSHDKPDEARSALARIRNQPQNSPPITARFNALVHHRQQTASTPYLYGRCITSRKSPTPHPGMLHLHVPRRLALVTGLQTMATLMGIQTANLYLSYLLRNLFAQASGSSSYHGPLILATFLPTIDFLFTIPPLFLLPRLGIRKLMITGSLGLATCLLVAVIVSSTNASLSSSSSSSSTTLFFTSSFATTTTHTPNLAPTAAVFTVLLTAYFFYDLGWNATTFLFQSELGPSLNSHDENTALASIATATRFAIEVAMVFSSSYGVFELGRFYLLIWLFTNLAFAAVVFVFYPETVGRSLEEIDLYFARAPRKVVVRDRDARGVRKRKSGGYYGGGGERGGDGESVEVRQWHGRAEEMVPGREARMGWRGVAEPCK